MNDILKTALTYLDNNDRLIYSYLGISHVGIVAEDTGLMINATGSSNHERNATSHPLKITKIEDKGLVLIKARIAPCLRGKYGTQEL